MNDDSQPDLRNATKRIRRCKRVLETMANTLHGVCLLFLGFALVETEHQLLYVVITVACFALGIFFDYLRVLLNDGIEDIQRAVDLSEKNGASRALEGGRGRIDTLTEDSPSYRPSVRQ